MKNQKAKTNLKILLATDGSAHSKIVLENVARRTFPPKTEVRIVTAYERIPLITRLEPMGASEEYSVEADNYTLKTTENINTNAAKFLRKNNPALIITSIVIEGSPKTVILEESEKFGADLIIVGSHGAGAVERFLLGSVSHAVSLHAKCSVEIVRK